MSVTYGARGGWSLSPPPGLARSLALGGGAPLPLISGPQSPRQANKKNENKNRSLALPFRLELFRPVNGQSQSDTGRRRRRLPRDAAGVGVPWHGVLFFFWALAV